MLPWLEQKWERWLAKRVEERMRAQLHLTPTTEFANQDVFIVGYPKSGHTWFQNLVAGIVYGVDPAIAPDTLIQELVPDLQQKNYYKRFQTPMFFKSHYLPRPEYRRVVYLLRDGRDVMVSFLHHNRALYQNDLDLMQMITQAKYLPGKWHEHVERWMANPYAAEMLIIRYETLIENPLAELTRFCAWINVKRSDAELQNVIQKCSFANQQQKEKTSGWDNREWPKDKLFIRRGQIGSYKDEMPPDVLQEFWQDAQKTLARFGYV